MICDRCDVIIAEFISKKNQRYLCRRCYNDLKKNIGYSIVGEPVKIEV